MTNPHVTVTRAPAGTPQTNVMGSEELRGRSVGSVIAAVMGLTWAGSATGDLSVGVAVPVLLAGAGIVAVLMTGARRLGRAAAALPASPPTEADLGRVRRRFHLVFVAECGLIVLAVNILVRSDHAQWIPAVICVIVGLHFVPLARLFAVGLYYATGVALCLVAMATMILGAIGAPEGLWRLLPGIGAAVVLWATSARLLVTTTAPTR